MGTAERPSSRTSASTTPRTTSPCSVLISPPPPMTWPACTIHGPWHEGHWRSRVSANMGSADAIGRTSGVAWMGGWFMSPRGLWARRARYTEVPTPRWNAPTRKPEVQAKAILPKSACQEQILASVPHRGCYNPQRFEAPMRRPVERNQDSKVHRRQRYRARTPARLANTRPRARRSRLWQCEHSSSTGSPNIGSGSDGVFTQRGGYRAPVKRAHVSTRGR